MPRLLQQAFLLLAFVYSCAGLAGCEGAPARSKPWRHSHPADVQPHVPGLVAEAGDDELAQRQRRAGTLRIHMRADPGHLQALVAPTQWGQHITADTVFESLLREVPPTDAGGVARYEPALAATVTASPGGRDLWIELREGVRFHDGSALSSLDVQFSIDRARDPRAELPVLQALLRDVVAVDIAGQRSIRLRLARPSGYVLRGLAAAPILPAAVYERNLVARKGPVVGSGPYRIAAWTDELIALERNPEYWGLAPAIERIEFVRQDDAAAALTAAKRGELDILPALIPEHYPDQANAPAIASSFSPLRLRPPVLRYLALGQRGPPLDDVRVRQAISLLVDRQALADERYAGLARPIGSPVWPGGPGDAPAVPPPSLDPGRAAALLDGAGWTDADGDGSRERDGVRLRVVMIGLEQGDDRDRERIKRALTQAGFFVEERRGSVPVLMNRLRTGDFDLALLEWRAVADTDLSSLLSARGADNYGGFADASIEATLDQLRAAPSAAERRPLAATLGRQFATSVPFVPLVALDPYGLVHHRVRNVHVRNGWLPLRDLSLARDE